VTEKARRFRPWQIVVAGLLVLLLLAGVDLAMQEVYHRYLRPVPPTPTPVPTARPTRTPSPRPTVVPTLAPTPSPTVVLTQTLAPTPFSFEDQKVQEALQGILFREQLIKVSLELLRAEDYLDSNEMKQVERELIAVGATLETAGRYADESLQDTIADLQRDVSRLREDLYLRPERLREGVRRLWQRVDVLIGE
jgi:hypothetical protein